MVEGKNQAEDQEQLLQDQHIPQDFEAALAELESLTSRMSEGNLSLEDSIAMYQRGVDLARNCQKTLDAAEKQVKVLQDQLLVPFETDVKQDV